MLESISKLFSDTLIYILIFMSIQHWFHYYNFILSLKGVLCKFSNFFFIFDNILAILSTLIFHVTFIILIEIIDDNPNAGKIKPTLTKTNEDVQELNEG